MTKRGSPSALVDAAGRSARAALAGLLCLTALAGCDDLRYPQDPGGTLDRVLASDRIRVAAADNPPFVSFEASGPPVGVEAELVTRFAADLGVEVDWRRAGAFEALEALGQGEADLAIGGFDKAAVQAQAAGAPTVPYLTERTVVAALAGRTPPGSLDGEKVLAPPELMVDRAIREKGGIPVADAAEDVRLVAVRAWRLPGLGLVPTGIELDSRDHVMAVPKGENAWLMQLELFLRAHDQEVAEALRGGAP